MSLPTPTQRKMFTRHYGMLVIGAISTAISVLGGLQGHIPEFSTYVQATAIPDIITILDFALARLKDPRGLMGLSVQDLMMIYGKITEMRDKFPRIQLAGTPIMPPANATVTGSIKVAPAANLTSSTPGTSVPTASPAKPNVAFTINFVPTPDGQTHGIKQGNDIIVKNQYGPDYMFYGFLQALDGTFASVTWDGFNDGAKDGILVIHTQKSVKSPDGSKQIDVPIQTGIYKLVLRDDPTPTGQILGETDYFRIF